MSYINFKEERFVVNQQLCKRKNNNIKLYKDLIKKKDLGNNYNPCKVYSYTVFDEDFFGKKGIQDEEDFSIIKNKDIVGTIFTNCKFSNIKFIECKFIGCIFEDCDFDKGGAVFENCTFLKEESNTKPSLNRRDNLSCRFTKCTIYTKFLNCILAFSIFEDCIIKNTDFEQCNMESSIIINCEMDRVTIIDSDLSGLKVVNTYIKDIDFKDKYKSKLDEKSFIDKIPIKYKSKSEYEGIYMCYETIANKFQENTLKNNFGEYYYLCKVIQRKSLKTIPKIQSFVYWATCGYGERPLYSLICSIVLVCIFAILYLFLGVEIDNSVVIYNLNMFQNITFSTLILHLNEALTLSLGMFAGVGTINCDPINKSYIIANIEVLVGVIMMGVGIATITRKIIR